MFGNLKITSANDPAQATFSSMVAFTMEVRSRHIHMQSGHRSYCIFGRGSLAIPWH